MKSVKEWADIIFESRSLGETVEAIREEQRQACAAAFPKVLRTALLGGDKRYRYKDRYVRWGLVEQDMKDAILSAGKEKP